MFHFEVFSEEPIRHCKEFEDNYRGIELARLPKIRLRTNPITSVIHHLREYLCKGLIHIQQVSTNDQCADTWTKPFPQNVLVKHCKFIFGF